MYSAYVGQVMGAGGTAELAALTTFTRQGTEDELLYGSAYGQMGDYRAESLSKGKYILNTAQVKYTRKYVQIHRHLVWS